MNARDCTQNVNESETLSELANGVVTCVTVSSRARARQDLWDAMHHINWCLSKAETTNLQNMRAARSANVPVDGPRQYDLYFINKLDRALEKVERAHAALGGPNFPRRREAEEMDLYSMEELA